MLVLDLLVLRHHRRDVGGRDGHCSHPQQFGRIYRSGQQGERSNSAGERCGVAPKLPNSVVTSASLAIELVGIRL